MMNEDTRRVRQTELNVQAAKLAEMLSASRWDLGGIWVGSGRDLGGIWVVLGEVGVVLGGI